VRSLADRVGLDPVVAAYRDARMSDVARRDRTDMDHLDTMLGFWLADDANCIDVGANVGRVLRMIERHAPHGHHHAFEPIPDLARALRLRFPDVRVHEQLLSDHAGEEDFTIVDSDRAYSGASASLRPLPSGFVSHREVVQAARLDDVVPADYTAHFVKIDVEGGELAVLRGAPRVLAARPLLFIEHGADAIADTRALHALLIDAGYAVYDVDGGGPHSADDLVGIVASGKLWNFVGLVPRV